MYFKINFGGHFGVEVPDIMTIQAYKTMDHYYNPGNYKDGIYTTCWHLSSFNNKDPKENLKEIISAIELSINDLAAKLSN